MNPKVKEAKDIQSVTQVVKTDMKKRATEMRRLEIKVKEDVNIKVEDINRSDDNIDRQED
jgi:hypothetical protein